MLRLAAGLPLESKLYPMLSLYLASELGIHSKRINEKRSSKSEGPRGNQWLFADVIGMEDLTCDWHDEVRSVVKEWAVRRAKVYSFEVKRQINRSSVRENFFQAVSNSSWANYGYLVAAEIAGTDTLKELRMLSGLHGIGVMRLNVENPTESEILIPARERLEIDWATCSRIAHENEDFRDILKQVRHFLLTGDPVKAHWDSGTLHPDQSVA